MENAVGDGATDFELRPIRVTLAKAEGEQATHGGVHAQRLGDALLGCHGAVDRRLPRGGVALVVGDLGCGLHGRNVAEWERLAREGEGASVGGVI